MFLLHCYLFVAYFEVFLNNKRKTLKLKCRQEFLLKPLYTFSIRIVPLEAITITNYTDLYIDIKL